jgi:hypothetical protein
MNNYLIIHRHGQWIVFDLTTHDLDVFSTKQEAEYHVYELCALEEINALLLANLN